jgi:hypothetical protein
MSEEHGPIYNVPLIDSLPLTEGGMRQAMPSRADLDAVHYRHDRVVAGYEVLLAHYQESQAQLSALRAELEAVNALGRQWGFGQGELDDDLAGCLARKLAAERAARESNLQAIIDWLATDKPPELAFASGLQRRIADEIVMLRAAREAAERRFAGACTELHEVQQVCGKALGYPRYCDDRDNFPGATEADGVCPGEHSGVTIAGELAERLATVTAERDEAVAGRNEAIHQWRYFCGAANSASRKLSAAQQRVERLKETIRLIVNPATPFRVVRDAVQAALTESESTNVS